MCYDYLTTFAQTVKIIKTYIMKKITFLMSFLMLLCWQAMAQTSTLYLTTSGGSYATEKWVSITDGPNGTGNVIWAQGNGTYGDSQGLVTDESFTVTDGVTYYINCYDRYADGWDGTTYEIRDAIGGGGLLVANNGGNSPDDGTDNDGGSTWETPLDELEVSEAFSYMPPSCPDPTALTATNITATSADLGWTDPTGSLWHIEWDTAGFTQGTGNFINNTTTNPQNVTGLTANTAYEFYVISDCGVDSSNWVGPFAFTTACNAFAVPFVENFNSTSTTESCWTVINNNNDGDLWDMNYTSNPLNGDQVAAMYTDFNSGANDDYLVTPTLTLTGNERLRFHYRVQSAGEPNDFQVTLSTTGVGAGNFTNTLMPLTSVSNITYQEQTISLAAYTGNVNIAFHIPSGGLDGWRLYIDSVVVEAIPACPDPTALTATNITATSADLGWTDPTGSLWHIEWDTAGFTQGTGNFINNTTTNPQNVTGLTANTAYEFYVISDCGVDSSNWVGPFAFTTACNAFAVPFVENFNSTSTTESCWTVINNNNDGDLWDMNYTSNPLNGDQVAAMYTDFNSGANDDYLVTPTLTLTGNERLRFHYRVQSAGEPNDFQVTLSTTGVGAGNFTNTLMPLTSVSNITYQEQTISLAAYTGNVNIAFHIPSGGLDGWRLYIDSVVVEAIPACPDPTALTATNITATSADLGWTDPTGSLWDIEWDTAGFTQGAGNFIIGTTTNPHNLTGLTPNTNYEFYVRTDCGVDSSNWVGPFAFTTACASVMAPWNEDFENSGTIPSCWNQGASNSENWLFANTGSGNHIGNNGIMGGATTSGNYFAWIDDSTPDNTGTTLESPFIDVSSLTNTTLSFFLISNNEGNSNVDFSVDVWDGAAWNVGFYTHNTNTVNGEWEEITVSLSSLTITGDIQLRFIVDEPSNGDFYDDVAIDDVRIYEPLTNDIGVIAIESAPIGCGLGNETVTIKVKNYGLTAETGFDVAYALNSVAITPETVSATVNPGDTLTYVFTTLANMSTPGAYTIGAWTDLTTDGDNNNDTLNGWMTEHLASSLAFSGNMAIPDNDTEGINSIICTNGLVNNMLDSCYTLSALVIDSLVHSWETDLDIWLISPAGDTLEVSTDNGSGSGSDGYINVTFTDTASINPVGITNLNNGFFNTEEAAGLAKFNGTNPEGAWTLLVKDDLGGDTGVLYDWHLEFTDHNFTVNLGADTNLCPNQSITLDAGAGNYSYAWSTGDNTQQVTLDTNSLGGNGTYNIVVTVTDTISGCASIDTIVVDFSPCSGINALANNVNVNVYPNPNNGQFTLNVNTTDVNELSIKVVNLQGQEVYNRNNFDNLNTVNEQIDLSNNANGIYFVIVTTDKGIVTHKMIVQ